MATITRANTLTAAKKQQEFFSDFFDSFVKTPFGNDLARITNERDVNQSLKNLIQTNLGERLFQPTIGSNVNRSLFEMNNFVETNLLEFYITNTIQNNEPRVILDSVTVIPTVDEGSVKITVSYYLINNPNLVTLDFILRRIR
jgi:phage baseplate assembly protein W